MRGTLESNKRVKYEVEFNDFNVTLHDKLQEIVAVGIIEGSDSDIITENEIRERMGLHKRAIYSTNEFGKIEAK